MADDIGSHQARLKNNQEKMVMREQQRKALKAELDAKITSIDASLRESTGLPPVKLTPVDLSGLDKLSKEAHRITEENENTWKH